MFSKENQVDLNKEYSLLNVEKIESPEEDGKGRWYRYEIGRDSVSIVGSRRGTLEQVKTHAQTVVEDLNARSGSKKGSVWSAKKATK